MSHSRARIGLTQRADDVAGRDERRDSLDQRWVVLLEHAGWVPVPIPNRLADPARFAADLSLDLVVLTGGNDLTGLEGAVAVAPERDETEHRLLDHLAGRGIPTLGVCRGMQAMVVHYGGTLTRVDTHVGRPHRIDVVGDAPWPIRRDEVNSYHGFAVRPDDLGPHLTPLAFALDGTVEAACHRELPAVAVMWHPERPPSADSDVELIAALLEGARRCAR